MPKVSIIIPAYNAHKTIARCVESILNQTFTDFELLVMDDGSTDETGEILDRYAAGDSRIRVVHKENSGVSDTRNQALSLAQGEYIQFLDADDWVTPDATRLFVRSMEESENCGMVIADFYRVIDKRMSQKGDIEEERLITREEYADFMMHNPADFYYGVLWNKFFRRSIIEAYNIRMDENLNWAEDFIFNMEYILHTRQIYVLKVPVYYYVKTEGSLVVQGGMSISKTVQMKLNVIEYYSRFYKNIYTSGDYYMRRPAIYAFLVNFAKDGAVNPVLPDRRIGQSRLNVSFSPEMSENPFVANFYEERMLESAMERVMNGNDLEENDVKILLYLTLCGGTAVPMQIRNFTGLSARAAASSLQKLQRRGMIERVRPQQEKKKKGEKTALLPDDAGDLTEDELFPEEAKPDQSSKKGEKSGKKNKARQSVTLTFGEDAGPVRDAIARAFRDVEELQLQNFSQEEQELYRQLRGRVTENMLRSLYEPAVVQ